MKRDDDEFFLPEPDDTLLDKIDRVGDQKDGNYSAILQLSGLEPAPTAEALHNQIKQLAMNSDPCKKVRGRLLQALEYCMAIIAATTGKGPCGQFTPPAEAGDGRRAACSSMMAGIIMGVSDMIVNLIATQPIRLQEVLIKGFKESLDKSLENHPGILKNPNIKQVREKIARDKQVHGQGFTMTMPSTEKH